MIHDATRGFSIGAETYRSARPSYHPGLVSRFVERYATPPVIELGAGTGTFTAQVIASGVEVVATEPVAKMRAILASNLPGSVVLDGAAESIPASDDAAGTVVGAQAFHWFDHRPALDEVARVLRPGGWLVTVWNVRDDTVPWVRAYTDIVDRYAGDTPRHRTMRWRQAIDADDRFEPVDDWSATHPVPTTADGVVDRALSTSFIAALPQSEQHVVRSELRRVVDPLGDEFDYPYRAELQAWRVRPS